MRGSKRSGGKDRGSRVRLFALLAAGAAAGLLLCEGILRLTWENRFARETPSLVLELPLHPAHARNKVAWGSGQTLFRTDGRHYIEPSAVHADPEAVVAFLGGSTTECAALPEDVRFPALTAARLADRGHRVNVLNAARSGNTLHDSLNILLNHVSADRPDILVVMHAANDLGALSAEGSYARRMGGPVTPSQGRRWTLQSLSTRWRTLALLRSALGVAAVARLRGDIIRGPRPRAALRPGDPRIEDYRARLRAITRLARALEIQPVLMTQPVVALEHPGLYYWLDQDSLDRMNGIVRETAREERVPLVDLAVRLKPLTTGPGSDYAEYLSDGMHVTEKGAALYADLIAARLAEIIVSSRPS